MERVGSAAPCACRGRVGRAGSFVQEPEHGGTALKLSSVPPPFGVLLLCHLDDEEDAVSNQTHRWHCPAWSSHGPRWELPRPRSAPGGAGLKSTSLPPFQSQPKPFGLVNRDVLPPPFLIPSALGKPGRGGGCSGSRPASPTTSSMRRAALPA